MSSPGGHGAVVTQLIAATLLMVGCGVSAQTLDNGSFDTGVTGWNVVRPAESALVPDTLDADGNTSSGSALGTNTSLDSGGDVFFQQCMVGGEDGNYLFGGEILIPGEQTESGEAFLQLTRYSSSNCGTEHLGTDLTSFVTTSTTDVWVAVSETASFDPNVASVLMRMFIRKNEAGGSLRVHFDNLFLTTLIFEDGFESGDVTAWSATVP
jgi:hypothetical protein